MPEEKEILNETISLKISAFTDSDIINFLKNIYTKLKARAMALKQKDEEIWITFEIRAVNLKQDFYADKVVRAYIDEDKTGV